MAVLVQLSVVIAWIKPGNRRKAAWQLHIDSLATADVDINDDTDVDLGYFPRDFFILRCFFLPELFLAKLKFLHASLSKQM